MSEKGKKIVISINTSWNIFNFRLNLIYFLQKKGFQIIALSPEDAYSSKLKEAGILWEPIKIENKGNNPIKDAFLVKQYYSLLKKHKPDIALFYTIKPNIYGSIACRFLNIPVINNVSGLGTVFIRNNWISKFAKALYKVAFKSSDVVFFQNEDDRNLFIETELIKKNQSDMLPGSGVDLEKFKVTPLPKNLHFLFIGRLLYDKGIIEYLEACKKIKSSSPEIKFSVIGKVEEVAGLGISPFHLNKFVDEGIVDYLGTTDNIADEIEKASVIVLPSYREGTPRTLLEGGAMGRPIITTNVPGCKNLIKKGYNGWMCEAKNSKKLTKTIKHVIDIDNKKLTEFGLNNRTFMELHYNESIVFEKYHKAITQSSWNT